MINSFSGDYRWLSNFWITKVDFEGMEYPSSEHAYVAAKTVDLEIRKQIQTIETAGQVKRLGRQVSLRSDWEDVKVSAMFSIVLSKFLNNNYLADKLIDTYPQKLVEGNTWGDTFWGVDQTTQTGSNNLGKILEQVRDVMIVYRAFRLKQEALNEI